MENFVYFHRDFVGPQLGETEEVCIWELVLRFVSLHMNVHLVGKVWICIYLRIPVLISLMEKTGCKIICGAPTTLAVKGLMMMMITVSQFEYDCYSLWQSKVFWRRHSQKEIYTVKMEHKIWRVRRGSCKYRKRQAARCALKPGCTWDGPLVHFWRAEILHHLNRTVI